MQLLSGATFRVKIYLTSVKAQYTYFVKSPPFSNFITDLNEFIKTIADAHCKDFNEFHDVDDFCMMGAKERLAFDLGIHPNRTTNGEHENTYIRH